MTNEYSIGYLASSSLVGLAVMCLLYMIGGRSNKWIRRFIASLVQTININLCAFFMGIYSFWLLLIYPITSIGLSFGYGGETFVTKLIRRSIFCIANLGIGILFLLTYGMKMLWILIPNIGVAMWSIYLGIRNPVYAPAEEVFVCALLYLMSCAYPFVVGIIK
jgi:hypothetical protein